MEDLKISIEQITNQSILLLSVIEYTVCGGYADRWICRPVDMPIGGYANDGYAVSYIKGFFLILKCFFVVLILS